MLTIVPIADPPGGDVDRNALWENAGKAKLRSRASPQTKEINPRKEKSKSKLCSFKYIQWI